MFLTILNIPDIPGILHFPDILPFPRRKVEHAQNGYSGFWDWHRRRAMIPQPLHRAAWFLTFCSVLCSFLLSFAHHGRALCASWELFAHHEGSLRLIVGSLRLIVGSLRLITGMTHKGDILAW